MKKKIKKVKTIEFNDFECVLQHSEYECGQKSLELIELSTGEPVAMASVALPEKIQQPDEIFIKSWSENEGMADVLEEEEIISAPVGKYPQEHVNVTIHKLL